MDKIARIERAMVAPTDCTVLVLNALVTQNKVNYRLELTKRRLRARKRAILLLTTYSVVAFCTDLLVPNSRSVWVHLRSSHWWEDVVFSTFSAHDLELQSEQRYLSVFM